MSTDSTPLTSSQAIALLHRFTVLDQHSSQNLNKNPDKNPDRVLPNRDEIYKALSVVVDTSEYQMLGICAPDFATGMDALADYLAALGDDTVPKITELSGPCYIKYNGKTRSGYSAPYEDGYRGVLIACQSSYDGDINETFGHFPLDLFRPQT